MLNTSQANMNLNSQQWYPPPFSTRNTVPFLSSWKGHFFQCTPVQVLGRHQQALELISTVGCSVSLAALTCTILVTLIFWKKLGSVRTKVLLHLCFFLAGSCVLVIIADRARESEVCTVCFVRLFEYRLGSLSTRARFWDADGNRKITFRVLGKYCLLDFYTTRL